MSQEITSHVYYVPFSHWDGDIQAWLYEQPKEGWAHVSGGTIIRLSIFDDELAVAFILKYGEVVHKLHQVKITIGKRINFNDNND